MNERKQINFTIVPDDTADVPRTYANFCAISHTPFDFTLAFCEVLPLSEKDIQNAEAQHVVRAPVRSKIVVPLQVVPNLIAALQEHMRVYSESTGQAWDPERVRFINDCLILPHDADHNALNLDLVGRRENRLHGGIGGLQPDAAASHDTVSSA